MAYENVKDLMEAICDAVREREGSSNLIPHQELPARISNAGSTITAYETVNDLMTGICDAVRETEGSSELIPHQELPDRIRNAGRVYFYNFGDECVDITGGWSLAGVGNYWGSQISFSQIEKQADSMYIVPVSNSSSVRCIFSQYAVNMGKYAQVYIKVKTGDFIFNSNNNTFEFTTSRYFTYDNSVKPSSVTLYYRDKQYDIYKLNVNNVTGNKYLKIHRWGEKSDCRIYAIWAD